MKEKYDQNKIKIEYVDINNLKFASYNPRKHTAEAMNQVTESIKRFGIVDPFVVNSAPNRKNVVIGGHLRLKVARILKINRVPVVYTNLTLEKEKELNLRLNKNQGEWDLDLLAEFDESFLSEVGFSSEDLDEIFEVEDEPEIFDLEKELAKLDLNKIEFKKGDIYTLGNHKLMCGDSTKKIDIFKLMSGEKADMCFTDPPYILDYLRGKKKHKGAITGFGAKRDRRYLETDVLPPDFTERWMDNIARVQKSDFSIIVYENPKNLRTIWNELEKHWKYRNTIIWHLPNRMQGFAAKYKFFNKYDFAMLGTSGNIVLNNNPEVEPLLQEEYETALYATSGKPTWESYEKGKKFCPTDFVESNASDEKSSGQGIIFGTKPVEILIPYIKVLTQRGDLILEPFGGSGSTLVAAERLKRRCFVMEKSPIYCEVIRKRWENLTSKKAKIWKKQ